MHTVYICTCMYMCVLMVLLAIKLVLVEIEWFLTIAPKQFRWTSGVFAIIHLLIQWKPKVVAFVSLARNRHAITRLIIVWEYYCSPYHIFFFS